MCNFMGYRVDCGQVIKLRKIEKELGSLAALQALKSGFDYGEAPVIRRKGEDIEVVNMHWEFIPWWIKNTEELIASRKKGIPLLNATSEKLLHSKLFKDAALKRRCLIPVTHFFEWRHFKAPGEKKEKAYPYCIQLKSREYFFLAGIWQPWTDKSTGEMIDSFAVITTKANSLVEQIHNKKKRMPTILTEELAHQWIFDELTSDKITEIASYQYDADKMEAYTIYKEFKVLDNPLEAFTFEELPAL